MTTITDLEKLAKGASPDGSLDFMGMMKAIEAYRAEVANPQTIISLCADLRSCHETITYALDFSDREIDRQRFREALQNLKKWGDL